MTAIEFEDELLGLPAKVKIWLGVGLAATGAGLFGYYWQAGEFSGWLLFFLVQGLGMLLVGRSELAAQQAFDREVERGRSELDELALGAAQAEQAGTSIARFLQARGYKDYAIRRWLQDELQVMRDNAVAFLETEQDPPSCTAVQLRYLLERLAEIFDRGVTCDHTFAMTRRVMVEIRVGSKDMLAWFERQNVQCDCTVAQQITEQWGARVGVVDGDISSKRP